MLAFGFLLASLFFAALAFDAYRFEASSRFKAFAVPIERMGRAVGVDPLSTLEQDRAQRNEFTAVGGIPGLFWVFVVLAAGFLAAAAWSFY
ncbi:MULTISPECIES: hypothetical protein [unclassified Variovorax]|uniref:hypothetical protein n=1 Tax=unclassified Variovorax TaxID=663243 RepID=UPI003ECC4B24